MTGDDPPFLPVGTAVSAKYRGAFCEAKVKVIKKLVKCKIKFKTGPGVVVNDEFVKGPLKIGALVEAKLTENGPHVQGTVMKLNDASLYTVVFDDGDEKTLRRTLLCLQGEKHFHESETLDHLPLTDPENFGTPVMKQNKKRNRRSSQRSQSDDDEEEEDEEEEEEESDSDASPKKQRKEEPEDAVGKVVIVEFNEKRKNSLFPALVVDPSCTKDVQMRGKDQVVVRSFKDNKYYTVAKSNRKPFLTKDHTYKGDVASQKSATEKAVTFIDTGQLPSIWDLDMLKKKSKQGHVDPVDETSEDSSDDEYDMEKDAWLASLHKFMEERGTPINKPPVLGFRDLNLYKLYKLVHEHGGCRKVTDKQLWRNIMTKMGIPVSTSPQPYNIHTAYNKYLFAFEEFNRKMGPNPRVFTRTRRRSFDRGWITPGIISRHQSSSSSKQDIKDEPSDNDEEVDDTPKKRKKATRKREKEEELPASKPEPEPEQSREQQPPPPPKETPKRETRESKSRVSSRGDNNEEPETAETPTMDRGEDSKRTPKRSSREEKVTKDRLSKDDRGKGDKDKERAKEEKDKEDDGGSSSSSRERSSRGEERSRDRLKEEKMPRERGGGGGGGDEKSGVDDRGKDRSSRDGNGKDEKPMPASTSGKAGAMKNKDKKPSRDGSKDDVSKSSDLKVEYQIGEKVLVHYGRGRTEKIYEAKVVDIELKGKEPVFTVHYTGWNNRYDEAVKKSRIVGSAEKKKKKGTPKGGKLDNKDSSKKDSDKKEKEEEDRKKKDEEQKKEQEEKEARAREARELEERKEREKQERERQEKERKEKERKKEQERREKVEKERVEKERKDKVERERREHEERERKEKMEREKKEKEQRERQEKEKEKVEREKQEKERKEKEEREKEKEKADQERRSKEVAEKAKEAEKEKKEKEREKLAKEGKRTPTGKRGRPSLSKASPVVAPSPPRSTPTSTRGSKSPSPASVFTQRSMRSDRKSLETPFASGLYVRSRSTRSSTGDKHSQDSDTDADDADDQSESQQSTHDSEDSSKAKEKDDIRVTGRTGKTEAPAAATLIKVSEQKPTTTFDEDSDDGPPTLTAQVSLVEAPESRLQEAGTTAAEVPKTDVQKSTGEEQEVASRSTSRSKKDSSSKLRVRKGDREKDASRETAADLPPSNEKQPTKEGKEEKKEEEVGKKMEETPVLERQVPMETQLKEKLEEIKQEDKDSTSDADKAPEKRKGRKKGRKSLETRKRAKAETEAADTATKSSTTTTTETFEPKRKQAKVERRKSEKGGRKKQNEQQDSRLPAADNAADSDLVSSSMEEKSLAGTSKSFMTTPPTTPEGSPKMPSSPSQEDLTTLKGEEQSSNKSDSDALIEVASIDDKDPMQQTSDINSSVPLGTPSGATQLKATPTPTSQDPSPKKRRRGISESEPGKKRRKRSRRRKSSMSERRHPDNQDRGNSSDTDESRSDSRLMSSSASKHHFMADFSEMPPSKLSDSASSQKQRRWNFLVDLSTVKEPDERIAIIQRNLKDLRSVYTRLKQEVATIDRRRKKFRKKEREAAQVMAGVGLGCLSQGTEKPEAIVS